MLRFISLLVFFAFSVMFVSGCSSYTIERANVEIKKTPSHTDVKKDKDDEYEHDSREFGQSHKKEWSKEKYDKKKEEKEMKKKKEHEEDD